ncbi:general odorant-binding protein 45-like [Anopheles nili]|uniref:general odorant-binding protein 45-like n=1 Tax=Anopheles nili TaxID=185578 RepID=UPI00237B032C|nr:general odorant-binding protein 45-like [Anopheles nili]
MATSSWNSVTLGAALLLSILSTAAASFGARRPPPLALLEAQAVCVKYLGICEDRLVQYNNSVYPTDRDTMCMVRCAGLIVGFWDDTHGLKLEGLNSLFPDLAADSGAQHQIMSCAEQRSASCPPEDACARAYHGFRCFLQANQVGFGVKDSSQPQAMVSPSQPFSGMEFMSAVTACTKILRIPPKLEELYRKGVFPNDAHTRCLIRCVGIRTELYDDKQGPNLARLYGLFGGGQTEVDFRRRANVCMDANRPLSEAQDKCAQAYYKLYLCFRDGFGAFTRANCNAM